MTLKIKESMMKSKQPVLQSHAPSRFETMRMTILQYEASNPIIPQISSQNQGGIESMENLLPMTLDPAQVGIDIWQTSFMNFGFDPFENWK